MSEIIRPEARIFHIAAECYIIFLGNEQDEDHPFLRIGNSRNLTNEILDVIEYTVVADSHVGNPLLEVLISQNFHGNYLGDSELVDEMRNFFESFNLPSKDVTNYRDVQPKEGRDTVWFYNNGNIHLRFIGKDIFDLHERARLDGHFLNKYELTRAELSRNPVRYIKDDFDGRGIISIDGNIFWYENGKLLSISIQPGFAYKLMLCGIDPDLITAIASNLTDDDADSMEGEAEVQLLKRFKQRNGTLVTYTSDPNFQKHLQVVFRYNPELPDVLEIIDVKKTAKSKFLDSSVGIKNLGWRLKQSNMPEIVFFEDTEKGLSIDVSGKKLIWNGSQNESSVDIPNGYPIEIIGSGSAIDRLFETYLVSMAGDLKPLVQNNESAAILAIKDYVQLLLNDKGDEDESFILVAQKVVSTLKRCRVPVSEPAWFYLTNARSLMTLAAKAFPKDPGLQEIINALQPLNSSPMPEHGLPFIADLYYGKNGATFFWRMTRKNCSVSDFSTARKIDKRIKEIATPNPAPWKADYERLLKLIRSLARGKSGPLTAEQLALLGVTRQKPKPQQSTTPVKKETASAPVKTETNTQDSKPASPAPTPKKYTPVKQFSPKIKNVSPMKILLPVAIGLVALLIGGVVWDLTGSAPWGQLLNFGKTPTTDITRAADNSEKTIVSGNVQEDSDSKADSGKIESEEVSISDSQQADGTDAEMEGVEIQINDTGSAAVKSTESAETIRNDVIANENLNFSDRIAISAADIHLAANEIAVLNGYKDLDYRVYTGADPDWIYPGLLLNLPDKREYAIRKGDTIWFLADREVRVDAEKRLRIYDQALSILNSADPGSTAHSTAISNLEDISQFSRTEALREMATRALQNR